MVDEYLSEREQAEQLRQWLRENWVWIVAGVALALGGWFGWRWWESRQMARSLEAGARMEAMLAALGQDQREEGVKIGQDVVARFPGTPYADQATLVLARIDVETGELASAAERLARVAEGSDDPDLRLVARLRLARVQQAQGRYDDALATLRAADSEAVRARVLELEGDVKLARGDREGALAAWRAAREAAAVPDAPTVVDTELLGLKIDAAASGEGQ